MRSVEIVAYDPRWPIDFADERDRLRALPSNPIVDIEHFGSTAVPNLIAKPVIDILASVSTLDEANGFAGELSSAGYEVVDVGFRTRIFLLKMVRGRIEAFHLHLVTCAAWPHKNERLFRDWLIAYPDVARAYGELKRELAERFSTDRLAYTEAKTAFITAAVNDARRSLGLPEEVSWEE